MLAAARTLMARVREAPWWGLGSVGCSEMDGDGFFQAERQQFAIHKM